MNHFNRLVSEQMMTMEKLLYLQGELERCQEIEQQLQTIQNETELESVQFDINQMKKELKEIQEIFEKQTEEVIQSYRETDLEPSI
jgi:tRNA G26 N,N-dimethylase Trm1